MHILMQIKRDYGLFLQSLNLKNVDEWLGDVRKCKNHHADYQINVIKLSRHLGLSVHAVFDLFQDFMIQQEVFTEMASSKFN